LRQVAAVVESREEENDDLGAAVARKTRKPRSARDKGKSRSVAHLDSDLKTLVLERVVPSLIDYYGTCTNPWSLDGENGSEFDTVMTNIMQHLGREWNKSLNEQTRAIVSPSFVL
jgi:hypothetical protein